MWTFRHVSLSLGNCKVAPLANIHTLRIECDTQIW